MTLSRRSLGWIGLMGGVGGAVNAWLCYAKLPISTGDSSEIFRWHLIPAGFAHGALLAVIAVLFSALAWNQSALVRWILLPVTGWISGWLSFIPLNLSLFSEKNTIAKTLFWPFQSDMKESILGLWQYFGLVSAVYYLCLNPGRRLSDRRLTVHLAIGTLSGALGSLWWWIEFKPWYFSLLHGAIWGCLVGFSVWKSQQSNSAT